MHALTLKLFIQSIFNGWIDFKVGPGQKAKVAANIRLSIAMQQSVTVFALYPLENNVQLTRIADEKACRLCKRISQHILPTY